MCPILDQGDLLSGMDRKMFFMMINLASKSSIPHLPGILVPRGLMAVDYPVLPVEVVLQAAVAAAVLWSQKKSALKKESPKTWVDVTISYWDVQGCS